MLRATVIVCLIATTWADRPTLAQPHADGTVDATCRAGWRHPVVAAIVDDFRPPSNPYGPGNRGLQYATAIGDAVRAAAAGRVVFAGPVGGSRFVVVEHEPGLKSTYGYLVDHSVEPGHSVERGQRIAAADVGFHLTVRRHGRYIDPRSLMATACFVVRLVPVPTGVVLAGSDAVE